MNKHAASCNTIWIYWEQGFENAPEIVKSCKKSWEKYAGSNLIALDKNNLEYYLPKNATDPLFDHHVHIQIRSDIIRLKLLLRYGGIWVDSTVFCTEDYHHWLSTKNIPFPVWYPKRDRLIASWIIFSNPENKTLEKMHAHLWKIVISDKHKVWEDSDSRILKNLRKWIRSYFKRAYWIHGADEYAEALSLFSTAPLIKLLGGYPYLVFHYTFAYINWKSGNKKNNDGSISGKDSISLQNYLIKTTNPDLEKVTSILKRSPIHKLAHSMPVSNNTLSLLNRTNDHAAAEN